VAGHLKWKSLPTMQCQQGKSLTIILPVCLHLFPTSGLEQNHMILKKTYIKCPNYIPCPYSEGKGLLLNDL
jgi:hypothetical protein